MKIYMYDEDTKELDSILNPNDYDSVKAILYNLSNKNNGYLIYPKPLNINDIDAKKKVMILNFIVGIFMKIMVIFYQDIKLDK